MKRVIVACDSFKGTLSSVRVYEIIKEVLTEKQKDIEIVGVPMADGGEGTVEAFLCAMGGKIHYAKVKSPLMNDIEAYYGELSDGTAVIEMAQSSGITIEKKNHALNASSYGTGQLILEAINKGATSIVLGIGSSATTDGGIGCVAALGGKFLDKEGNCVPLCGKGLSKIHRVDLSGIPEKVKHARITVLCDVENPLYGENGAAFVYGPQKGANKEDVLFLDEGLRNLAERTKECLGFDYSSVEGAGAAGGLGFGMISFLSAKLVSGSKCILDMTDFENKAKSADLVITGEGRMDFQSLMGKVPFAVAKRSGKTKVIAVVGLCEADIRDVRANGISEVYETNPLHLPFESIKNRAEEMLRTAAEKITV